MVGDGRFHDFLMTGLSRCHCKKSEIKAIVEHMQEIFDKLKSQPGGFSKLGKAAKAARVLHKDVKKL